MNDLLSTTFKKCENIINNTIIMKEHNIQPNNTTSPFNQRIAEMNTSSNESNSSLLPLEQHILKLKISEENLLKRKNS